MKILILGGGGFLGHKLAENLLKRGLLSISNGEEKQISQIILFDVDQGLFTNKITQFVLVEDIWRGLTKAVTFSFLMAAFACKYGLSASGGAKGVGRATTNSVVVTLLSILGVDVVITYFQVVW